MQSKTTIIIVSILALAFITASNIHAACPSAINNGNITIEQGNTCVIPSGNTYILDRVTSEGDSTNTAELRLNGGTLTVSNTATIRTGSLVPNGGSIIVQNGGSIIIGGTNSPGIWVSDADADGYASSLTTTYTATAAGRRRIGLMRGTSIDCNDSLYSTSNLACINATGGTITNISGWRVHTFTSSGTFAVTSGQGDTQVLVVGGGANGVGGVETINGGGGGYGGGGGGVNYSSAQAVSASNYNVVVGGVGQSSSFASLTASGGSGATSGNGYGPGSNYRQSRGGAGGATAVGFAAVVGEGSNVNIPGNGGAGYQSSISGTNLYYGSGGGGGGGTEGANTPGSSGGSRAGGGGGCSGGFSGSGSSAVANSGGGGGGGGACYIRASNGGSGAAGIVIIRYVRD